MELSERAKKVQELMKLPQSLCKQCGNCCNCVIFKNGFTLEEMEMLLNNPNTDEEFLQGLKDFLSVFEPISFEEAQKLNKKFVDDMLRTQHKTKDEITFFHCRHLNKDKTCSIHEKRPNFCRQYPVCYKNMYYFDECGYAEQARKNWAEIEVILKELNITDI